jgi:hypothetical protein
VSFSVPLDVDLIQSCLQRAWNWRLGDDDPLGWSLTAGYAAAAALAALVALRAPFAAETQTRERVFWTLVTLFLAFMALNKQLELQTTLRETGRCIARAEGWYRGRGAVQERFVLVLAATLAGLGLGAVWWLRKALLRNLPALAGCLLLAGFIAVRAADIGNVARFLRWEVMQISGPRWVEMGGIALVLAGALWLLRRRRPAGRRP